MIITARHASNAQGGEGAAILPAGYYRAEITSADEGFNKYNGKPALTLRLRVRAEDAAYDVKATLWLTEKALWRVEQLLAAAGWNFSQGQEIDVNASDLIGRSVGLATCLNRGSQGGLFPDVMRFLRPEALAYTGAFGPEDREYYKLAADGTKADTQPVAAERQPVSYQQPQQPRPAQQKKAWNAYEKPSRTASYEELEEQDDIPF